MFDLITGVRKTAIGRFIGSTPVYFDKNYLLIDKDQYKLTDGLLELIFIKDPDSNIISQSDKDSYKQILIQTGAHLNANNNLHADRSDKIRGLIRPMFTGQGLSNLATEERIETDTQLNENNYLHADISDEARSVIPMFARQRLSDLDKIESEHFYWNDPNKLVDRLRDLIESQTEEGVDHSHEITSIIDQLRQYMKLFIKKFLLQNVFMQK